MDSLAFELSALFGRAFVAIELSADYGLVVPSNRPEFGHFQCNGALPAAKEKKQNPRQVAQAVVDALPDQTPFTSVTIAGPGFINVTLSDAYLARHVGTMAADSRLGAGVAPAPATVIIDYGGANVAKPLHVGHLRAGIIGQTLVNLFRHMGDTVIGDVHLGDWGTQMGMLICELARRQPDLPYFDAAYEGPYPEASPVSLADLWEMYPVASSLAKSDPVEGEKAREATVALQLGRPGYRALWRHFVNVSVADLRTDYEMLGIKFDLWLGESDADPFLAPMIEALEQSGQAQDSQGAMVVDVSRPDDKKEMPPLMLRKSDGAVLYGTTDLATIVQRMRDYRPDFILYVVDKRQSLHFRQVFRAAYQAGIVPETTGLEHIAFGTMNGADGRPFKTRAGGVMQLKDLIEMTRNAALDRLNEAAIAQEYDAEEQANVARMVGLAALKFGDLVNHRSTDYIFDLDRFSSFEGRTGPYLLYTTVRTKSILRKAAAANLTAGAILAPIHDVTRALMLKIAEMPDILGKAYETRAPNHICEYTYALAGVFNRFYRECHILREPDAGRQASWLALSAYFVDVMELLLGILTIEVPERM